MSERLGAQLFSACDRYAETLALEDLSRRSSYAELGAGARAISTNLRSLSLLANEPVLVAAANESQDIISFLGVWAAGGVVVPVDCGAPAAALEARRAAVGARLMISANGEIMRLGEHPAPPARPLLEDAALIIFTSGSTGAPKGVVLGHAAFARKLAEIDSVLGFSSDTRALLVLRTTFVFGIWFSLLTLLKGGSVFMCQRFDPVAVMADLADHRITDVAFVPTMLRRILAVDPALVSPFIERLVLDRIHTGGEPFSPALGERVWALLPNASITDIYGLTETASSDFFQVAGKRGPFPSGIGRISNSEKFRIADALGREMPAGEVGELQILTPFIMNGYLDRPDLTQAAFAGDYFRTGDMARRRADGTVELVGRNKDLIMRAGTKISPLELDGLIAQHPAVAAALTVGVADDVTGERIHVLVVPRAEASVDERELRRWVAERLERFKRPDVYHFGSELPTGSTGKVDRDALRQSIGKAR